MNRVSRIALGAMLAAAVMTAGMARGSVVYVATNSAPSEPYNTWASAATNIHAAIDYVNTHREACDTVVVAGGRYAITNEIKIASPITVRSAAGGLSGASNTVLTGKARKFSISHPGAAVQGFTITGGQGAEGAAVYMTDGAVSDCIISGNKAAANKGDKHGGGVCMTGGIVSNSIVKDNTASGSAGGIYADKNSRILHCLIVGNQGGRKGNGGGICAGSDSVLIRNCLITGNSFQHGPGKSTLKGGGVYGGTVENCTIAGNRSFQDGGGVCKSTVINSIIFGNRSEETANSNYFGCTLSYTCTAPDPGPGNISADPLFVDAAAGDYRLKHQLPVISPCINAGTNLAWMAAALDLDRRPRLMQGIVDMGVFEYLPESPVIFNAGLSKVTGKAAMVRCNLASVGGAEAVLSLFHGPADGGSDPRAWANEYGLPGPRAVGSYGVVLSPDASNTMWHCHYFATNRYGAAWAESASSFLLGVVEVRATRRDATEEQPADFVISRPATATNGPLAVYFSIGGGINGRDFDLLDNPATIPAGASETKLTLIPIFSFGDTRPKFVTLAITEGAYGIGAQSNAVILARPR